jgi:hypothetical protein
MKDNEDRDRLVDELLSAVAPLRLSELIPPTISDEPLPIEERERLAKHYFDEIPARLPYLRGACSFTSGKPRILLRSDLPPNLMEATFVHESAHWLKAKGLLKRDLPLASALGYIKRWFLERASPTQPTFPASPDDNWKEVLHDIDEGRFLSRTQGSLNILLDDVLRYYDTFQVEDAESYRWGALFVGIALETFDENESASVKYLMCLTKGLFHLEALQILSK